LDACIDRVVGPLRLIFAYDLGMVMVNAVAGVEDRSESCVFGAYSGGLAAMMR
jgi:hypothetical protein